MTYLLWLIQRHIPGHPEWHRRRRLRQLGRELRTNPVYQVLAGKTIEEITTKPELSGREHRKEPERD